MKKQFRHDHEDKKTDLRHDTMEFSAATDGDDVLDADLKNLEDDDISAEELDFLEDEDIDAREAALSEVEHEHDTDEDTLPEEDWTDDLPDESLEEEEKEI